MTKKITALLIAFSTLCSMSVTAFAADMPVTKTSADVTLINLSDKISDNELSEIKDTAHAYVTLHDGTIIPIDSVVTVEDVVEDGISPYSLSDQKSYKVTVQAAASSDKIVSDSDYINGKDFNASATLQLIWTDGPGLDNYIKQVSGTLNVVKGTVTDGTVSWGDGWSGYGWDERDVGAKSSFSYSPNKKASCPQAMYSVLIDESFTNLYIHVSSSVIQ